MRKDARRYSSGVPDQRNARFLGLPPDGDGGQSNDPTQRVGGDERAVGVTAGAARGPSWRARTAQTRSLCAVRGNPSVSNYRADNGTRGAGRSLHPLISCYYPVVTPFSAPLALYRLPTPSTNCPCTTQTSSLFEIYKINMKKCYRGASCRRSIGKLRTVTPTAARQRCPMLL